MRKIFLAVLIVIMNMAVMASEYPYAGYNKSFHPDEWQKFCPVCGNFGSTIIKTSPEQRWCKNNHSWAICPVHKKYVVSNKEFHGFDCICENHILFENYSSVKQVENVFVAFEANPPDTAYQPGFNQKVTPRMIASWAPNTESDLAHYTVYAQFDTGKLIQVTTQDTSIGFDFTDVWPDDYFYHDIIFNVTASDFSNNESEKSKTVKVKSASYSTIIGDVDLDGTVSLIDVMTQIAGLGKSVEEAGYTYAGDINSDGTISLVDIMTGISNIGKATT